MTAIFVRVSKVALPRWGTSTALSSSAQVPMPRVQLRPRLPKQRKEKHVSEKIKIALGQGATCSGCDIAVLDLDVELLKLFEVADLTFAPLAADIKFKDVEAMEDGEITISLYHGAVRNSENEHVARLLRKKSQIMVAYGACAAFGGIPGLANVTTRNKILDTVYDETATTVNPEHTRPQTHYQSPEGHELELPELFEDVKALDDVVDVDYIIGACPPTREMNVKLLQVVLDFVQGNAQLPPKGTILASERTLCDECPRQKPATQSYSAHLRNVRRARHDLRMGCGAGRKKYRWSHQRRRTGNREKSPH